MDYKNLVNSDPVELVKTLVKEMSLKKAIDVRYEFDRNDQWSVVSIYVGEEDNELALRLHAGGAYEIYVGYYGDDDELHEISKTLTDDQAKNIPANLRKVMLKVVNEEEGLRVPGKVLSV